MNRADVGMIECRRRLRFTLKTFQRLVIFREPLGQEFQRHEAMEFGVLGLVDDTHPAAAELLEDAIVGDRLANHCRAPRCVGHRSPHGWASQRASRPLMSAKRTARNSRAWVISSITLGIEGQGWKLGPPRHND